MRWFAIKVAYDGTDFGGWQIQSNATSIQQRLMEGIEQATGERVILRGSGRTDAGVHAIGQVATFALQNWRAPADRLVPAINRFLPRSIVVRSAEETVADFDPTRSAKRKRYRYEIWNSRVPDPMRHPFQWWIPRPLDLEAMRAGANFLLGTHDFRAFETLGSPRKTSVRTVYDLPIESQPHMDGSILWIDIEADGFLYNMVRNIVGALVAVGSGRFSPRWIESVRDSLIRDPSSQTAPAQGLCLMEVFYENSIGRCV